MNNLDVNIVKKLILIDLNLIQSALREMMCPCEININDEVIKKSTININSKYMDLYIVEIQNILKNEPVLVWSCDRVDDSIYLIDAYKENYMGNPLFNI